MKITRLDHVQLAMPPGGEEAARAFYGRILQLRELEKPEALKPKGGCWFAGDGLELHLGVQADFFPRRRRILACAWPIWKPRGRICKRPV
mgnify:CR=1 FL=1